VCLMACTFLCGMLLIMGKNGSAYSNISKNGAEEQTKDESYRELLADNSPIKSGSSGRWIPSNDRLGLYDNKWYVREARYNKGLVTIHLLGVQHSYAFFRENYAQIKEVIKASQYFAKEDVIFSGEKLNRFAEQNHVALLNLHESRLRIRAIYIGPAACFLCILLFFSLFVVDALCVKIAKRGIWRIWKLSLGGRARKFLGAIPIWLMMLSVAVFAICAYPVMDIRGGQKPATGKRSFLRPFDRFTYDFFALSRMDSRSMFEHLLNNADSIEGKNEILVLTGALHTKDFQDFFKDRPDWNLLPVIEKTNGL
jgi:hypothetical protein